MERNSFLKKVAIIAIILLLMTFVAGGLMMILKWVAIGIVVLLLLWFVIKLVL